MSRKFCRRQSHVLFAMLLYVFVTACCGVKLQRSVIAQASLRKIPMRVLQDRLSSATSPGEDLSERVYEILDDGFLTGPNLKIDLRTRARQVAVDPDTDQFTYTVNGEHRLSEQIDEVVHEVGGYNLIYREDGTVVALWGDGLFLEPLDNVNYRGVFINTERNLLKGEGTQVPRTRRQALRSEYQPMHDVFHLSSPAERQTSRCRRLDLAVAYDNELCKLFDNSATKTAAYVKSVVSYAKKVLKSGTCHRVRLVHLEAHCQDSSDPYAYAAALNRMPANARPGYVLNSFQRFWMANRAGVSRDAAYFFSGFDDGTSVGGAAFIGAACTSFGYGWAERGLRPITTHEIGHTLGADHSASGIMKAVFTGADDSLFFSSDSKRQIDNYMNSAQAICMQRGSRRS